MRGYVRRADHDRAQASLLADFHRTHDELVRLRDWAKLAESDLAMIEDLWQRVVDLTALRDDLIAQRDRLRDRIDEHERAAACLLHVTARATSYDDIQRVLTRQ